MRKKTPTKKSLKKISAIADKIFGKNKKLLKTSNSHLILILSAKNIFIFFAVYNLEKYGKIDLNKLSKVLTKDYYEELYGYFLDMCQTINEDTGKRERDYRMNEFRIFLSQTNADESISTITRNQASSLREFLDLCDYIEIRKFYNNYMKKFKKNINKIFWKGQ